MAVYWKVKPGRKTPDFKTYPVPVPDPVPMAKEPGNAPHPSSKGGPMDRGA